MQTISKSVKPRQGVYFSFDGKTRIRNLDRTPRHWRMVVEKEEIGKNRKGKTIYTSRTRHLPA